MAYTNAIFYLDYDLGNDATRTGLTSCSVSNPSGTVARITKVGHGLITGAVVTGTSFGTAYYNAAWKVTKVDDDNFDLDTAVYTASTAGTITPFGGQSWADAWKTITYGATAARIAPGDTIRIAKSPAPTLISGGDCTWTANSKTVTLGGAQTATICRCESVWTANAAGDMVSGVSSQNVGMKEGSYYIRGTIDAAPQANTMQMFFATGDLTLSGYQKISFWVKNEVAIVADNWSITLCSNADGTGVVDEFLIPAIPSTAVWLPLTLARVGGGDMGSSTIKSIALNTKGTVPTASKYVNLDNFIACTTNGLNLQSLISKNSTEQGGTDPWHTIQSIVGTTVLLDNGASTYAGAGRGYGGATGTVPTYFRETIKTALASSIGTVVHTVSDTGSVAGGNITFSGGWNTGYVAQQDGETFFDGLSTLGVGIYVSGLSYLTVEKIHTFRYYQGFNFTSSYCNTLSALRAHACYNGFYILQAYNSAIDIISCCNCDEIGIKLNTVVENVITMGVAYSNLSYGVSLVNAHRNTIKNAVIKNNTPYGMAFTTSSLCNKIYNMITASNSTYAVTLETGSIAYFYGCVLGETQEVMTSQATACNAMVFSHNHDGGGNHVIFTDSGLITNDATTRHTASGLSWKLAVTGTIRNTKYPLPLTIARVYLTAGTAHTIKCYLKKTHATDTEGAIRCRNVLVSGVLTDYQSTAMAANTDWQELTLTITPDATGVYTIEAIAWWVSNAADESVYVDDMTLPVGVATSTLDIEADGQPWAQNAPSGGGGTRAYGFFGG